MIRLFVVGCSRSGTSILQRLLVEQLNLWSLPETAFFKNLGASPVARADALCLFADILDHGIKFEKSVFWRIPRSTYSLIKKLGLKEALYSFMSSQQATNAFVRIMDSSARIASARGWVEKTPLHCLCIREILASIPSARIIFVLRHGEAVTASILDRARRYPEQFGHQNNIKVAVQLWNQCIAEAAKWQEHPATHLVSYETLTSDIIDAVRILEDFVGIKTDNQQLGLPCKEAKIVGQNEPWKSALNAPIRPALSKFDEILSEKEREYAQRNLHFDTYEKLLQKIV